MSTWLTRAVECETRRVDGRIAGGWQLRHQLAGLCARGALETGPAGNHVGRVALTSEGRDLAERGLGDLAPLLDRLARCTDSDTIVTMLGELAATTRLPPPRWEL